MSGARLGVGVSALIGPDRPHAPAGASAGARRAWALAELEEIYRGEDHLLRLDARGVPQVAFKPGADGRSALRALLHCAVLATGGASGGLAGLAESGELGAKLKAAKAL